MESNLSNETKYANDQRSKFIVGLRELADFIENNPTLPVPSSVTALVYSDGAELTHAVRSVRGKWAKTFFGSAMELYRSFPGRVSYRISVDRHEVCEKKVIGTETVLVPDPDAPLVEKEREIVEWDCNPILRKAIEE